MSWTKKNPFCKWCTSAKYPHVKKGLCSLCYEKIFKESSFNKRKIKWRKRDCELVLLHKIPDRDLSKLISRSVKAIQNKRSKLKRCHL